MTEVVINLPFPVSVNALYRNVRGRGRVMTERHKTWRQAAGWELEQQRPKNHKRPCDA